MTRVLVLAAMAGAVTAASVFAQTTDSSPDVTLSPYHAVVAQNIHANIRRNLQEAAEAMPAADYGFRPVPEVRTFGQVIAHVVNANMAFCAQAAGERPPEGVGRDVSDKETLVKAIGQALSLCDRVYSATTDSNFSASITVAANGRNTPTTRGGLLTFNSAHNTEHYGNLVIYLRLKGIVPPSTARARQPQGR